MGGFFDGGRAWLARLRPRGRRAVLLRRAFATALFLAAAALSLAPASAPAGELVPTVVSARDLPSGGRIAATDLRIEGLPAAARPAGSFDSLHSVAGMILAGATRVGEPITDARVVASNGTVPGAVIPGTATVPIRLADPAVAGLLRPGSIVDVVAPEAAHQERQPLAGRATVVTTVEGPPRKTGAPDGPLVLIAVPVDVAPHVARVSLDGPVAVTLR